MKNFSLLSRSYRFLLTSVFLTAAFFFSTGQVHAAKYYMDSAAGNDANIGTSEDKAWKTLGKLHGKNFLPGDIISFKRGSTWDGPLVINDSGTQAAPIIYTAYGIGAKPIITGKGGTTYKRAIELLATRIIIEDFTVRDAQSAGIEIFEGDKTKNVFFDHNIIRRVDFRNIGIGVTIKSSNNRVEESTFDTFVMVRNTPKTENAEDDYGAIAVNLNAVPAFEKMGRREISGNIITKNTVKNAIAPSYDYTFDGGFIEIFDNVDNTTISYNTVQDSKGFIEIGGNRHAETVENLFIHHNISMNNTLFSFTNIGTYGLFIKNYQVFNNVIYEAVGSPKTAFWFDGNVAIGPTEFSLKNNILYLRATVSNKSTILHQNNVYNRLDKGTNQAAVKESEIGFAIDASEKITDAKFIDPATRNFRVKSGSPAIDAGQSLGLKFDLAGLTIPQGGAPDIGVYENGVQVSPSPTLAPPSTPLASPSPTTAPTCNEDINEDRIVNLLDFSLLTKAFLKTPFTPVRADINKDGKVDLLDFTLLKNKFLVKC